MPGFAHTFIAKGVTSLEGRAAFELATPSGSTSHIIPWQDVRVIGFEHDTERRRVKVGIVYRDGTSNDQDPLYIVPGSVGQLAAAFAFSR